MILKFFVTIFYYIPRNYNRMHITQILTSYSKLQKLEQMLCLSGFIIIQ